MLSVIIPAYNEEKMIPMTVRALSETLDGAGIPYRLAPENLRWQSAWGVAMAARDKAPAGADDLLPVYLRLSQAERERQERLKAGG